MVAAREVCCCVICSGAAGAPGAPLAPGRCHGGAAPAIVSSCRTLVWFLVMTASLCHALSYAVRYVSWARLRVYSMMYSWLQRSRDQPCHGLAVPVCLCCVSPGVAVCAQLGRSVVSLSCGRLACLCSVLSEGTVLLCMSGCWCCLAAPLCWCTDSSAESLLLAG